MSNIQKVTMGLTEKDVENVQFLLDELNTRTKAGAVSASLNLAKALVDAKKHGSKIIIKNDDGTLQELLMP